MAAQQPLSSGVPPTDVYGGDEVSALVLDPGYCLTRAGFAGEEVPKQVVPSFFAYRGDDDYRFGDDCFVPRDGLEVRSYMSRDSIVEDWDAAQRLWEYVLVKRLQPPRPTPASRNGLNDDTDADDADNAATNGNAAKTGDRDGDITMDDAAAAAAAVDDGDESIADAMDDKPLADAPLLMTEPAWNPSKSREKAIEIAMESWGTPAFWLSRSPVLAAFAAGKATGLVLDVGGANASVVGVHDGMVLKRSIQRSPVAGLWLSGQIRTMWAETKDPGNGKQKEGSVSTAKADPIVPAYLVASKRPVEAGAAPDCTLRRFPYDVHPSFHAFEEERTISEFKESVVEVWRGPGRFLAPGNEDWAKSQLGRVFEMPDGSNQMWREQRFRVTEGLWDAQAAYAPLPGQEPEQKPDQQQEQPQQSQPPQQQPQPQQQQQYQHALTGFSMVPTQTQTMVQLIKASLDGVDIDLRPNLLANVVVTGGTTLINGFNDRLNNELTAAYPGLKIKIHAAGLTAERRFGAWIGGSILASLGTFHQMWISRKEYEENGAGIVDKRCK